MKPTEAQLREGIVRYGRKLAEKGFVAATDGNISVRLPGGLFLVTPSNLNKGDMTVQDIVTVDIDGRKRFGRRKPTSEFLMHRRVYEKRSDVHAVVHAHPPTATGFACAGVALDQPISSEVILALGKVPLAAYGTPGTMEIPDSLMCCLHDSNAILLANHGVVAYGQDLAEAYGRMETVEQYANITLVTKVLGQSRDISAENIARIIGARKSYFAS